MNPEIVGCSSPCERNKNLPGFTTDYTDPTKRPLQLVVLA